VTAFVELALVGAIYGLAATLAFRRFTDAALLRRTINRILAHTLEFRLFLDEPRIVLRAQRELLAENVRLLRQVAFPCVILAIPFALFYGPMDRHFGHGPLRIGEATVVTAPIASGLTELKTPPGVVAETSGVRVLRTGEISWRVRPVSTTSGGFPKGVEVRYPGANILGLPWVVWFLVISTLTAFPRAWQDYLPFPRAAAAGCCYF
jgi:hypothetical protein